MIFVKPDLPHIQNGRTLL